MNHLSDINYLKNFFKFHGLKPRDYLGQNFLVDEDALSGIVQAADLKLSDTVLEVGPGLGILTTELAKQAKEVWAIEKDQKLFSILEREFRETKNLKIVNEDILRFHVSRNILSEYKVVANIPYYLTSKLLQFFLEQERPPKLLVLMVQKEVGERVTATAGELSILGISVQVYADADIVLSVPKTSFWPAPEVDSVVLKITPKNKYPQIQYKKLFFRIIKVAFSGKRKQIQNTLSHGLHLEKDELEKILSKAGIEPTARPQDLSIEQWINLYEQINLLEK